MGHDWGSLALGETRRYLIRPDQTAITEQRRLTKVFWSWRKRTDWRASRRIKVKRAGHFIHVVRVS